ncbi:MAG: PucR family transcriptional regulator [Peptostreptococcaceae bacterium]|nr:PucR family transcriptional regulator [Peptostreptococcaceae bacterium]
MKITIRDCLQLEVFKNSIVMAGNKKLENRVRTISVLDETNLEIGIKNNGVKEQLVLTHFWQCVDDIDLQCDFVRGLAKSSVSALVIFCTNDGVKSVNNKVVELAEMLNFPLVSLFTNSEITYSNVLEQIQDKILYGDNFKNSLINNTIYHLLNFEKHSSFQAALRESALKNDFQVVLLSEEFNPVLSVETRHRTSIEEAVKLGKKKTFEKTGVYTLVDVNGVLTYWGPVVIAKEKYFLFIVDNEDNYSAGEITKLAEIIELAIGMWKYTPESDATTEFVKALFRGNKSLGYSIKDEADLGNDKIIGVFYASGIENEDGIKAMNEFNESNDFKLIKVVEDEETYGVILKNSSEEDEVSDKVVCLALFDKLKEKRKEVRVFHVTGIDGIEGAADGFKLINETWTFVESVFPYKRVFTKYELALVSNCINIHIQNGHLKKTYLDLLESFNRELAPNKAKQLLETLETFVLDAGMNSNKTASFMNIHTNTVQYRLKRINEILGAEITGNRVIPGLTMALALQRLEQVV